jgi:hypothetical protein
MGRAARPVAAVQRPLAMLKCHINLSGRGGAQLAYSCPVGGIDGSEGIACPWDFLSGKQKCSCDVHVALLFFCMEKLSKAN